MIKSSSWIIESVGMKLHRKTKVSLNSITRVLALLQFLHMLDLACEKRLLTRNVFLFIYMVYVEEEKLGILFRCLKIFSAICLVLISP